MSKGYRPKLSGETKFQLQQIKKELKEIEGEKMEGSGQQISLTDFKWRREDKTFDNDWIIRKAVENADFGDLNEF